MQVLEIKVWVIYSLVGVFSNFSTMLLIFICITLSVQTAGLYSFPFRLCHPSFPLVKHIELIKKINHLKHKLTWDLLAKVKLENIYQAWDCGQA